ncbi:MAG: radical SAM protein, partial [Chloroflexota bacterium]
YRKPIFEPTKLQVMYLVPTDNCNFDCKYCFIYGDLPKPHAFTTMAPETADLAVDFFARTARNAPKLSDEEYRVVFYGGEPLLNKEIVYRAVKRLVRHEAEGAFSPAMLTIVVVTNGSLVDDEFAKFAAQHAISVSVSLDGLEQHHDRMRVLRNSGHGTFATAIAGFEKLVQHQCNPSPTITIGEHNFDDLEEIVRYYVEKYHCPIGLNIPMQPLADFEASHLPEPRRIAEKIVKIFQYLRQKGIYEDKIIRYIKSFITRQPRLYDCCGGCGEQFVVAPDGMIGACQIMLSTRELFNQNVQNAPDNLYDSDWLEWKKRSPFLKTQCLDCEAIAICGGGCPYISWKGKGDIRAVDDRICEISKYIQEWLIWDVYEQME